MLQSMGTQSVRHDLVAEQQSISKLHSQVKVLLECFKIKKIDILIFFVKFYLITLTLPFFGTGKLTFSRHGATAEFSIFAGLFSVAF